MNYTDFRGALLGNPPESQREQEEKQHFTEEVFHKKKPETKELGITFEQCCKLICIWFPVHKEAVQQISLLRKLMRRPVIVDCGIFINEEGYTLTKRMCEDFSFKQITKVAKNLKIINAFVTENQAAQAAQAALVAQQPSSGATQELQASAAAVEPRSYAHQLQTSVLPAPPAEQLQTSVLQSPPAQEPQASAAPVQ